MQLIPDDSTIHTIYSALTTNSSIIWLLRVYKNKIVKTVLLNENYCYCWNVAVPADDSR